MSGLVRKILKSPLGRPIRYAFNLRTSLQERLLNIETGTSASGPGARLSTPDFRGLPTEKAVYGDNTFYAPSSYRNVKRMLQVLAPVGDDVFYDLGCGKGRVVCMAARLPMKRVVGVELFDELCVVARQNAQRLRGRIAPIDIICADATKVDYADGTLFTFYHPFGELTMRAVMKTIRESFHRKPRNIRIAYHESPCEHVLAEETWLEQFAVHKSLGEDAVSFWRSKAT